MLLQGKTAAAFLVLFTGASLVFAQEPALPSGKESPVPAELVTPPPVLPTPLPNLTPAALPTVAPVSPLNLLDQAFKKSPMGQAAEEYRMHVEWRKLQNVASIDPKVIAAKQFAMAAPNDLEKRKRFRVYYDLYYDRMLALAKEPDVKAYVTGQKGGHIATTAQDHVRPSATPTPPAKKPGAPATPTPIPTATPKPTPTPTPTPSPAI